MNRIFLIFFLFLIGCSFESQNSEICFIGDSITFQWDIDYYFPGYSVKKHAVVGAIVQDIDKWNTSDCESIPTVLLMGTNNIGTIKSTDKNAPQSRKYFVDLYMKRATALKAEPLIAISILPRNYNGKQDSTVNINTELQNDLIKDALDSSGIPHKFINVFPDFLKNGYTINENLFGDGLHPSPEGYEILRARVQEAL